LGVEADAELTSLDHSTFYPLSTPDTFGSRVRWQGSARARAGYAFDRVLVYVTGGIALADIRHSYNLTPPPGFASESESRVRAGWTLGGGVEYAVTRNWSARLEYRYTDYGRRTDAPAIFGGTFNQRHRETQQAVRAGVSYRF
jgi:outer membrane immunogenic protein